MIPTLSEAADLIARWDFVAARALLEDLVELLPAEDLPGLTARQMLAEVLREMGAGTEAFRLASEVADESRVTYGADHPTTVRAAAVLGTLLHERGALVEAERQYLLALHSGAQMDGPAGRALLLARANLALLRRDQGAPDVARRELADTYEAHRRTFGPGDPDTLRLGLELGRLYAGRGETGRALDMLADTYATAYAALGAGHPLTALAGDALAEARGGVPVEPVPVAPAPQPPRDERFDPQVYRPEEPGRHRRESPQPPAFPAQPWGPAPYTREPTPPARRRRWPLLLAAGLLLAVAAVSTGLWLRERADAPGGGAAGRPGPGAPLPSPAPASPARVRPPPADVRLRDAGTRITVTWTDTSGGQGTVLLAVSRGGQTAGPLHPLPAGTEQYVLTGTDPAAKYCVIIAIVYPGDAIVPANQVCTTR